MSALDAYLKRPADGASGTTSQSGQSNSAAAITAPIPEDAEDLKTDIPFFDDPPSQSQSQYASGWSTDAADRENVGCTPDLELETDADAETELEPELDDGYTDSDYASGSAANSYYQSPTPSNSDIMLRPPSNTTFQYSYPSPGSTGTGSLSTGPSTAIGAGRLHPGAYTHSQTLPSSSSSSSAASSSASSFYPNMWYPNAPYCNGSASGSGSGSGSGHTYNRYGGYAVQATGAPFAHGMLQHHAGHVLHPHPHHHHPHSHPHPHSHHPHTHSHPHHQHPHPHETMMEMFQLSNSGREARNRAEKNRRDKLNGSIQELSTMVPHVAESPRRVDKTAVLRFAAHGLRLKYVFGKTLHLQRPQVTDTLMEMLDSFFLTLTCHGQILLISPSIEQHLGHCQTDLYGQSILQIAHPEDHEMLKQQLIPTELENLFDAHADPTDDDGEPRQRSKSEEDYIDRKLRDDRRSFRVRLARAGPRSEPTAYEVVKIDGCFRRSDEAPRGVRSNTFSSSLQLIRRTRGRDDAIPLHTISGNDIVLTALARIIRPPKIVNRLFDANTLEYRTRHLIDGRIIDCDQRIGVVAGYMTDEVRNLNPFTFMHNDDVRWVIVALRQMYDCNSSYGESTYRLFTRNGNIIYLQSKGYLEIDKETNRVHSFVCVNTLLDDEEGKRRVQEMKKKFSVIINTQIPQSTIDVPASEHPAQLEKAVLRLIHNLRSSADHHHHHHHALPLPSDNDELADHNVAGGASAAASAADDDDDMHCVGHDDADDDYDDDIEEGLASITSFSYDTHANQQSHQHQQSQSHSHTQHSQRGHSYHLEGGSMASSSQSRLGSSKTPPLALVPPETSSVKSSISKSVSVVNVTAAKHLRGLHSANANASCSSAAAAAAGAGGAATSSTRNSCTCLGDGDCDYCQRPLTPETSVMLKRCSASHDVHTDNDSVKQAKRRFMPSTEIEHVLSNSLEQIQRDLHQQVNVAAQLRDQCNRYELPDANQRIDEILEEHQKQSKEYVNIKSDFEEQLQSKAANTTKTDRETETDTQAGSSGSTGGAT
ncbi:uncharacterized protein LOC6569227 isoform X2 [Drosophila grimshawi]|uniref:uncharacterized protein LOC6569227 isoform X2 n=1 Tax=Drosophila grimshawi TaxID=7222 RepID=UPI000C8707E9|nr:uncharacterized protein LOC6569227 isoform X2 [Drosophila grimshawi]